MRSLHFPHMFNTNSTRVWKTNEYQTATIQNAELLLQSERGELLGDPYYGVKFKQYLYDQKNKILEDYLTDLIYTQLVLFIPQLYITRSDIQLVAEPEKGKLHVRFTGTSQIDYTVNTYNLLLYQNSTTE